MNDPTNTPPTNIGDPMPLEDALREEISNIEDNAAGPVRVAPEASEPPAPVLPSPVPTVEPMPSAADSKRRGSIRTYYSDVAEVVRDQQVSMTDIAIAEQKKAERDGVPRGEPLSRTGVSRWALTLGAVLFALGGGALAFVFFTRSAPPALPPAATPGLLIRVDATEPLVLSGRSRAAFLEAFGEFSASGAPAGGITALSVARTVLGADEPLPIGGKELLELLAEHADQPLLRSIEDAYLLGVYTPDGVSSPFLALSIDFFENAFAGMLRWEPFLADDLPFLVRPLESFDAAIPEPVVVATTTASTTPDAATTTPRVAQSEPFSFADRLIANRDTRALQNARGDIRLVYSFPRHDILVIAPDAATLTAVFSRLTEATFE